MRLIAYMQRYGPIRLLASGAALALTFLAGCGETTVSDPLAAARVESVTGASLRGPAGAVLSDPIVVRVFGSDEQPLPGTLVVFSASEGGSTDPSSVVTDGDGTARTRWMLGKTAGPNVLTATAAAGVSTAINATVTAAKAATVTEVAGDNQTAAAGAAVPIAPSVRVADAFGNLVPDVAVTFSVLTGGGRVTNGVRTTNAQGIATVGSWVLGPAAGIHSLAARVEESGVANNPIVFTATATTPTGSQMVATVGNNQQAPVGRLVPVAPTVVVRNTAGDGVPGVVVTFAIATGGGSVVGSRQVTDATGTATVGGWFLGPLPGANTLTASSAGLTSATFTATGISGLPVSMVAVSQVTQSAPAGTNVGDPPSVIVRDVQGIPVAGIIVTFSVTSGGGSVVGSPDTTNSSGVATLTSWKLGTVVGPNTVTATAAGLPSVTFSATGTAGAPASVVAAAGDNQTAVQGTNVAIPPAVRVTDASGNPVIGATVVFSVTSGGGSATGLTQPTNTQGQATVGSWTLGSGAPNTLRATVTGSGITGNPVTFTAQSATQIAITSAPAGPINLGTNFTVTVQLRNSAGAAVVLPGVQLTIAIASGGGTLNGTVSRVTDASGAVSFTLINVTGTAGARTFTITGTGLQPATTAAITFN
jgi:adhesin/invasin